MYARMRNTRALRMLCRSAIGAGLMLALLPVGCGAGATQANREKTVERQRQEKAAAGDDVREVKSPDILPETHMAAGRLHESQGQFALAIEQYRRVIAINPKTVEAYNRLGVVLDQLGRFTEADEAFRKGIAIAPGEAHVHNNLAFSYILQARWEDAQSALNQAVKLKPGFTRARVNLGMVLAQQGRFDEALQEFARALPEADAYYNLGLMYQSKHKLPEAARAYKAALERNAKLVAAQKRLSMLPPDAVASAASIPQAAPRMIAAAPPAGQTAAAIDAAPAPSLPERADTAPTPAKTPATSDVIVEPAPGDSLASIAGPEPMAQTARSERAAAPVREPAAVEPAPQDSPVNTVQAARASEPTAPAQKVAAPAADLEVIDLDAPAKPAVRAPGPEKRGIETRETRAEAATPAASDTLTAINAEKSKKKVEPRPARTGGVKTAPRQAPPAAGSSAEPGTAPQAGVSQDASSGKVYEELVAVPFDTPAPVTQTQKPAAPSGSPAASKSRASNRSARSHKPAGAKTAATKPADVETRAVTTAPAAQQAEAASPPAILEPQVLAAEPTTWPSP